MSDVKREPTKPPIAYTVPELAEATGISTSSIYAAIRAGDLRAKFVGRKSVVEIEVAQAWVRSLPDSPERGAA